MSGKSSIVDKIVIGFIILVIGMLVGNLLSENKTIILDNKVRISEVIGWFITITIGFVIGHKLKNKTENQKTIKTFLCSDLNDVILFLKELNTSLYSIRKVQKFEDIQRIEINSKMSYIDKKISSFSKLLETSKVFNASDIKKTKDILGSTQIELNSLVTGDDVYSNPVNLEFFEEAINSSMKFEYEIKNIILQVTKI